MCVTDTPDQARARAAEQFGMYGQPPSYRAILDREGAAGREDIAVIVSAAEVADRLVGFFSPAELDEVAYDLLGFEIWTEEL